MTRVSFPDVSPGRRRNMQAIRSKNTKPEMLVRRFLHAAGFRYRLHRKDLPGHPDITLTAYRTIVEIHGCFWHGHQCDLAAVPRARREYWMPKIAATQERNRRNKAALEAAGWRVVELWECELRRNPDGVLTELQDLLKRA